MQHAKLRGNSQRTPLSVPSDQDQRDGRKSGRTISIPVWFVLEGEKLYLLPVHGSDTQWYKNVLQNPLIRY